MSENNTTALLPELLNEQAQARLWQLLARQAQRYTMGDSSSLPEETARELLASICYTLDLYLRESGNSPQLLANADLDQLLQQGRTLLQQKIAAAKRLYQQACLSAPAVDNISYRDTLLSISGFFQRYDYTFLAQHIPCDIDYQLGHAVAETLPGVEYVAEYLRRLNIENDFLRRYDSHLLEGLLQRYCGDHQGLLINLWEPVMVNSLGLALSGGNCLLLYMNAEQQQQVELLLHTLTEQQMQQRLALAAQRCCRSLGIEQQPALDYLLLTAAQLYPRLAAATESGSLDRVFIPRSAPYHTF